MTAQNSAEISGDLPEGVNGCRIERWASVSDVEKLAATILPLPIWDFIAGGSGDERTLRANRAALAAIEIVPKVLAGQCGSATTKLVTSPAAFPAAIAPMAYQRLAHPDGEIGLAQAASAAGIPYTAGTLSSITLEEIAATGAELWFQLYWLRDRTIVLDLVRRAEDVGCRALMITVDMPIMARRGRDIRNGFKLPPGIIAQNLPSAYAMGEQDHNGEASGVATHTKNIVDPTFSWRDLTWLSEQTNLPLIVKGVLSSEDALRAAQAGAAAVVVSNHGGRQFDGAPSAIKVLPTIVETLAGSCQIMMDGGIRSGMDILRALALGADGVLIGRPALWGLAAGGAVGARKILDLLGVELSEALSLSGCPDLRAVRNLDVLSGLVR